MNSEIISLAIHNAADELQAAGIAAIYLFGSQGRGDASEASDIDLAFDVTEEANERFSVIDQARLQLRLQDIFGRKVDFIERRALRKPMREIVEREMVQLL
jgi:uncharacterized protein